MEVRYPQSTYDPLLHQWQGPKTTEQHNSELTGKIEMPTPATPPVVPTPEAPQPEGPVSVAPRFVVTDETVTILHGGSQYVYQGHQTTHRVHKDANGVEHIHWNKVMQPLPNLNVHVVRRDRVAKG